MLEVLKVPMDKNQEDEGEIGMSLELSIGGSYAKSEGKTKESREKNEFSVARSDFCLGREDFGEENGDLQKKREIQALRRQEARKKREEKLKKSSNGLNGLGFTDDKLFLEAQKFQTRVHDRETRENEEFSRKKKEKKVNGESDVLNLSLFSGSENEKIGGMEGLYPKVQQYGFGYPSWIRMPNGGAYYRSGNCSSSVDYDDSEQSNNNGGGGGNLKMVVSNNNNEQSSSAVSDYQSTSHKGGPNSDISGTSTSNHPEANNGTSSQTDPENCPKMVAAPSSIINPQPSLPKLTETSKPHQITKIPTPHIEKTSSGLIEKPPKPPNYQNNPNAPSVPIRPCVSATGNGPNGKTITGILYEYTRSEVSILCACHGSSFSPAGFVEHAGGVDVMHPLRHITILPWASR